MNRQEWIIEADINSMQTAMQNGLLTSERLVSIYLARIEKYDRTINSVLELNSEAIDIARALDKERQAHGSRSNLHGIPLLLKDNIDTGDCLHTSAGSITLAASFASEDALLLPNCVPLELLF